VNTDTDADAKRRATAREAHLQHIARVRTRLFAVSRDFHERGENHDISKLVSPEREAFEAAHHKMWGLTYGTPEYDEARLAMGPALQLHYQNNDHHPEHFPGGIKDMSLIHLMEMVCDWHVAVRNHKDGDITKSIDGNQGRFGYSDELKQIMHNTVKHLEQILDLG
jgi:hypothetical protein